MCSLAACYRSREMGKFLSELEIRCCQENENYWILYSPLVYESDILGIITIKAGFVTDLASTRHIPGVSFIWGSTCHREACIHDYLYRIDSKPVVSFSLANSIFAEAMESRGKSGWVRWPMFWGVWIGGYFSYHKRYVDWKPGDDPPVCNDTTAVQP